MSDQEPGPSMGTYTTNNEDLAGQTQKELMFKIKRAPENLVIRFGIVPTILALLECLLIISNNFHHFGYWERFISKSSDVRDSIFPSLPLIGPYSLEGMARTEFPGECDICSSPSTNYPIHEFDLRHSRIFPTGICQS